MPEEKLQLTKEARLIPWWAIVAAVILFVGFPMAALLALFPMDPKAPPVPVQIFLGLLGGTVFASLALLVGYVNADAKRRGMNSTLWTILVIFVPNAIGFIIYFWIRKPLQLRCPQCDTTVDLSFNYCPKCKFNLRPTCPQCHHAVRPGDPYCPYCAHELERARPAGGSSVTPVAPGAGA